MRLLQVIVLGLLFFFGSCDRGLVTGHSQPIVFVLAGQSNMVGHGQTRDLTAEQRMLPPNVRLFIGLDEVTVSQRSSFGPEVGFAAELTKSNPAREFLLVKYAIGTTSLLDWAPDWDAARAAITGNAERGALYEQLIRIIERLPVDNPAFGGVLWMQGERDARIYAAGIDYYQNLGSLISAFRRDLRRNDLPFLLGEINPPAARYPARDVVRDAQRRIVEDMTNVYLIETDDLSKWDDELHYDSAGILELGRRFAATVIETGSGFRSM